MRPRLAAAILSLTLATAGCTSPTDTATDTPPVIVPIVQATPQEDDPGWQCEIHGNLECGPHRIPLPGYPNHPAQL